MNYAIGLLSMQIILFIPISSNVTCMSTINVKFALKILTHIVDSTHHANISQSHHILKQCLNTTLSIFHDFFLVELWKANWIYLIVQPCKMQQIGICQPWVMSSKEEL